MKIEVNVEPDVLEELEYLVQYHATRGAPHAVQSVQDLIGHVLFFVAEGSRCPGSIQRSTLESMGLIWHSEEGRLVES